MSVQAPLTGVEKKGRLIGFADKGKVVKADTSNAKITVAGQKAKAADLKPGQVCTISYLGDGDAARSVTCQ
jgi:hypothetical protein